MVRTSQDERFGLAILFVTNKISWGDRVMGSGHAELWPMGWIIESWPS